MTEPKGQASLDQHVGPWEMLDEDPNEGDGMTPEQIQELLDQPVQPVGSLLRTKEGS